MGNPYPALITDANSETRVAGQITFTDSANQPGGGSPATLAAPPVILTPALVRAMDTVPIPLTPNPAADQAIIDAQILFAFEVGFVAYGAAFQTHLSVGGTPPGSVVLTYGDDTNLSGALQGGGAGDLVYLDFGAALFSQWSGSWADMLGQPLVLFATVASPTGGAGNVTARAVYSVVNT